MFQLMLIGDKFKEERMLKIKERVVHAGHFQQLEQWKEPMLLFKERNMISLNSSF